MKLKDLVEQYGEYDVEEWFEIGTDGVADEKGIKLKKPKPKTVWDLEKGDNHHWVDITGDVCINAPWKDSKEDKQAREIGNVFLTKEEAEKDVERRKVETLLLKYGGRRWYKKGDPNYYLWYDTDDEKLESAMDYDYAISGSIYFDTREQLEKAVEQIGAERIIKALFEVR